MKKYRNDRVVLENEISVLMDRLLHDGQTKRICIELDCLGGVCQYHVTVDTENTFGPSTVYGIKWKETA